MKHRILPLIIFLSASGLSQADEAAMQKEIETLKQQMQEMKERTEALADQQQAGIMAGTYTDTESSGSDVSVWGYGEINYNHPVDDSSQTKMDLRRAVIGFGYNFDDQTRFHSEFEFEHAVTSADDEGEVGVELFAIEHDLTMETSMKAGLFFIPMGLLNETHEPTRYYGVERNFVETAIIPTTWREGGIGLYGGSSVGVSWDVGVTTGFDIGKWDPTSTEGIESPLGSIHQELQNANARDLSVYLALDYTGIPGWLAGASVFTGKASQGNPAASLASDSRVTLWDVHTRWTPGNFDLAALYAGGTISDTADLNATFVGGTLIPEAFWGAYLQGAYKIALSGRSSVAPFVRYERVNTGSEYATLPAGLNVAPLPTETIWTAGVNYYLNPNVVFKADYQAFDVNSNSDRYNLGLGLEY